MIVAESTRGRRIVGRLDRGSDLFAALLGICGERRIQSGELRALGAFESAEVAEYDQSSTSWKPGRKLTGGGLEVLHLQGNLSEREGALFLHAHVTLMRERDAGIEVLGGHLLAARVFALEFVIESFDDLLLRRGHDAATGLALWNHAIAIPVAAAAPLAPAGSATAAASPPSPRPPAPASSPTWSQVAAASPKPEPQADTAPVEDTVAPGDVILHPRFGPCEVQRIEGTYEFVHVRVHSGNVVRLSLDVLKLSPAETEAGRRTFRARVAR